MVFLWISYTFSSGPVAVVAPPVATGSGCPLPFSYGFSMVFHTFSPGPVAEATLPAAAVRGCPTPVFLWFSTLSALGRWLECLHRLLPPDPAQPSFPMVFLWFSNTFSPGPVAGVPPPACHWPRLPASIFYGSPLVFLHFQPWAGGNNTSAGPPPAAGARFHFPMVFLWFSTLSALGRWL